jgi:AraC family transcriptional regulator
MTAHASESLPAASRSPSRAMRSLSGSVPKSRGLSASTAGKLRIYIEANMTRPLPTPLLASMACLSTSYFCRAFRVTFGVTVQHYVASVRMERACLLMRTTSRSLVTIAIDCGLFDQAHFCHCFRQHYGTSPGQWRRLNQLH